MSQSASRPSRTPAGLNRRRVPSPVRIHQVRGCMRGASIPRSEGVGGARAHRGWNDDDRYHDAGEQGRDRDDPRPRSGRVVGRTRRRVDARPLPRLAPTRAGRDGGGVRRVRRSTGAQSCGQARSLRRRRGTRCPAPSAARGAGTRAAEPPERGGGVRGRRLRRQGFRRHGVRRRSHAAAMADESESKCRGGARCLCPRGAGVGRRARGGVAASRLQTRQRHGELGRASARHGLRPGASGRRHGLGAHGLVDRPQPARPQHRVGVGSCARRRDPDAKRCVARHAGVHVSGADPARRCRRALGPVLILCRSVRGVVRKATLLGAHWRRGAARDPARTGPASPRRIVGARGGAPGSRSGAQR